MDLSSSSPSPRRADATTTPSSGTASEGAPQRPSPDGGGEVYASFVERELEDQRASKASIEQRGIAVVTTSGILVTLLFGLAALVTESENFVVPEKSRPWLYLALLGFVVAAGAALITNLPRNLESARTYGPKSLDRLIRLRWDDSPRAAKRRIALTRLGLLHSYKKVNNFKGRVLIAAVIAEVVAVAAVAVAVTIVLAES